MQCNIMCIQVSRHIYGQSGSFGGMTRYFLTLIIMQSIMNPYACTYWNLDCAKIKSIKKTEETNHETDLPAEEKAEKKGTRIQKKNVDQEWKKRS